MKQRLQNGYKTKLNRIELNEKRQQNNFIKYELQIVEEVIELISLTKIITKSINN